MDKETKMFIVMFTATLLGTAIGMHLWMRYYPSAQLAQYRLYNYEMRNM